MGISYSRQDWSLRAPKKHSQQRVNMQIELRKEEITETYHRLAQLIRVIPNVCTWIVRRRTWLHWVLLCRTIAQWLVTAAAITALLLMMKCADGGGSRTFIKTLHGAIALTAPGAASRTVGGGAVRVNGRRATMFVFMMKVYRAAVMLMFYCHRLFRVFLKVPGCCGALRDIVPSRPVMTSRFGVVFVRVGAGVPPQYVSGWWRWGGSVIASGPHSSGALLIVRLGRQRGSVMWFVRRIRDDVCVHVASRFAGVTEVLGATFVRVGWYFAVSGRGASTSMVVTWQGGLFLVFFDDAIIRRLWRLHWFALDVRKRNICKQLKEIY